MSATSAASAPSARTPAASRLALSEQRLRGPPRARPPLLARARENDHAGSSRSTLSASAAAAVRRSVSSSASPHQAAELRNRLRRQRAVQVVRCVRGRGVDQHDEEHGPPECSRFCSPAGGAAPTARPRGWPPHPFPAGSRTRPHRPAAACSASSATEKTAGTWCAANRSSRTAGAAETFTKPSVRLSAARRATTSSSAAATSTALAPGAVPGRGGRSTCAAASLILSTIAHEQAERACDCRSAIQALGQAATAPPRQVSSQPRARFVRI